MRKISISLLIVLTTISVRYANATMPDLVVRPTNVITYYNPSGGPYVLSTLQWSGTTEHQPSSLETIRYLDYMFETVTSNQRLLYAEFVDVKLKLEWQAYYQSTLQTSINTLAAKVDLINSTSGGGSMNDTIMFLSGVCLAVIVASTWRG